MTHFLLIWGMIIGLFSVVFILCFSAIGFFASMVEGYFGWALQAFLVFTLVVALICQVIEMGLLW